MIRKILLCMVALVLALPAFVWPPGPVAAAPRLITLQDDLRDLSRIYKTSKPMELYTAPAQELAWYAGDSKLLKRTETGTSYVYYKANGKIKSAAVEMYFRTGLYVPVEFYVSQDDNSYVWTRKIELPLEETANGWKRKVYTLDTAYLNGLNAQYLRIPIPQNNSNVTLEPLLGNVTIIYETASGYLHNDAALQSITVGGQELPGFNRDISVYEVALPAHTAIGADTLVQAVASDAGYAEVSVTQATYLPGYATVQVTAEDGLTVREYQVYLKVLSGVPGMNNIYYVSTDGSDLAGDGSLAHPWRTIQQAANIMVAGDTCFIREGTYYEQVIVRNSGTEEQPIRFKAYPGEAVTVSGADPVAGWQLDSGNVYKAAAELHHGDGNRLFMNGQLLTEARWPNLPAGQDILHPVWATMDAGTNTTIRDGELPGTDGAWIGARVMVKGGDGWILQASTVRDYKQASGLVFDPLPSNESSYYTPRAGNGYYLYGSRQALDADGEWFYDAASSTLYLAADSFNPNGAVVEAKARDYAFVLRGLSHVELSGIGIFAAGLDTVGANRIRLDGLSILYSSQAIALSGSYNEIVNSVMAYVPTSLIEATGSHNRIVNNELHSSNYLGTWQGGVNMGGSHNLLSRNTIYDSGRTCVQISGRANIIEYNDIYNGGLLTNDTGLIYGGYFDADNTEIRYNWIHDNRAEKLGEGIYPDNGSTNYIIHHNVVWNAGTALRLNTPNNYMLVYNNTLIGDTGIFGHIYRTDMYGGQFINNILTGSYEFSGDAIRENNIEGSTDPLFVNRAALDFRLQAQSPARDAGRPLQGITDGYLGSAPDIGAYELGQDWIPGHSFASPPIAAYQPAPSEYRNRIMKGGFEKLSGAEAPWAATGQHQAVAVYDYGLNTDKKSRAGNWAMQIGNIPEGAYPPAAVQAVDASIAAAQLVAAQAEPSPGDMSTALSAMNDAYADMKQQSAELLGNPGFEEEGLSGWIGSSARIGITDAFSFSGANSLRSYERLAAWAGPRIKLPLINGRTYNVHARARIGAGTDTLRIVSLPNGVNTPRTMASGAVNSTGWSTISGTYTVNEGVDFTYGLVSFFTQTSLADLYLDDVSIVDVTELIAVIGSAQQRVGSLTGQVRDHVMQAITNGQAVLNNRGASEDEVAEAVRVISNALAQEGIVTKAELAEAISRMQAAVNRGISVEAGIQQAITGLAPNTSYRLSGWARTSAPGDTVVLGVYGGGGELASVTFDSQTWTRLSADFTTGPAGGDVAVYVQKPRSVKQVYVDDLGLTAILPSAPPSDQIGLIRNTGAESGDARPWFFLYGDLAVTDGQAHSGIYALKVANRQSAAAGAGQYMEAGANKTYDISVWVRLAGGTDTARLSVRSATDGGVTGSVYEQLVASAPVHASGWTQLTGQVTFSGPAPLLSSSIFINTESSAADFYVDDVTVKERLLPTAPGSGDGETDLDAAIADQAGWVLSKGSGAAQFTAGSLRLTDGNARYGGKTYRDAVLSVNMQVYGNASSWPIINIRNKGTESYSSGYVFVMKQNAIELQKYEDGKTTMLLFGDRNDPGTGGPAPANDYFVYGQPNLVQVGSWNTEEGVRLILTVNGHSVIDYEDKADPIRQAGYFGIYTGTAQSITLSQVP